MRLAPRRGAGHRAPAWRRGLAVLFALSVLGAGVALPAGNAAGTSHAGCSGEPKDSRCRPDQDSWLVTRPDYVRVPFGETVTLYMRGNNEGTHRLCKLGSSTRCGQQTMSCAAASEATENLHNSAAEARDLLIAKGVRDVLTGDGVERVDVRLSHLLEKLLDDPLGTELHDPPDEFPDLPLRYRFLNPGIDLENYRTAARPTEGHDSWNLGDDYRHPDVTAELQAAASPLGFSDHIQFLQDATADQINDFIKNASYTYVYPRLTDVREMLRNSTVSQQEDLLEDVREALRVDVNHWDLAVQQLLVTLHFHLHDGKDRAPSTPRGMSEDLPVTFRLTKEDGFFLLEDIPYNLLAMIPERYVPNQKGINNVRAQYFPMWPWTYYAWEHGYLTGLLTFLGLEQPNLHPAKAVEFRDRDEPYEQPASQVVARVMSVCQRSSIPSDGALRQVSPGLPAAEAVRGFGGLRERPDNSAIREAVVDIDKRTLLRDEEGTWWNFPGSYYWYPLDSNADPNAAKIGFYGPNEDSGISQNSKFWLRIRQGTADDEDHYVHVSQLYLAYDDGTQSDNSDDEWHVMEEGNDTALHKFNAVDNNGKSVLKKAEPHDSAFDFKGARGLIDLGELAAGGTIEFTGVRLGETTWEYCLNETLNEAIGKQCTTGWERVKVVVEPGGWDDARAWANDDAYRLLLDRDTNKVALLRESASGTTLIDGVPHEVLKRLCCVPDGADDWSLSLDLPVMGNDTVRFFRNGLPLNRYGNTVRAGQVDPADEAACPGSRYCTYLGPRPAGAIGAGDFGLEVRPGLTSLKLEISAPSGGLDGVSETRRFGYCLAHRQENCGINPPSCAVATYVEAPRAPNAPDVPALTTGDLPSGHFVANDLCAGADATVTVTVDVVGAANPLTIPEEVWNPPEEPTATEPAPARKCYDAVESAWKDDWVLDPSDDTPPAWCDKPQRAPADMPDGGCEGSKPNKWPRVWHEYANAENPEGPEGPLEYWETDSSNETKWQHYWGANGGANAQNCWNFDLPLEDYLAQAWLLGCNRPRIEDDYKPQTHVQSSGTRWQDIIYRGQEDPLYEDSVIPTKGDGLILVGRPLGLDERELCEGATGESAPRIVGVWPTHVGADNWITGPTSILCAEDPASEAKDLACTGSHAPGSLELGDWWHRLLDAVEPCVGAAECDLWVPPLAGWYQVRIEVAPPSLPMRSIARLASADKVVKRRVCEDTGEPDPDNPGETLKDCRRQDVMWTDPDAFVFDDLIWVQGLYVTGW